MDSFAYPDLRWPFVEANSEREGPLHVRMKNTAVFFLRTMGYALHEIETEYRHDSGWIDVAVERADETIVGVECETRERASVSNMRIVRDGHRLFALLPSGLYQVGGRGWHREEIQVQLTLGKGGEEVGRWFADGRTYTVRDIHPERREQAEPPDTLYMTHAPDGYNRWRADGEPKRDDQPVNPHYPNANY